MAVSLIRYQSGSEPIYIMSGVGLLELLDPDETFLRMGRHSDHIYPIRGCYSNNVYYNI